MAAAEMSPGIAGKPSFFDIGANLTDPTFQGRYRGKRKHPSDFEAVLRRAWDAGVSGIMITAGTLAEARQALEVAQSDCRLKCTVGVHPTRAGEFDDTSKAASPEAYMDALRTVIADGKGHVAAVGECGLDADRTQFCPLHVQQRHFERHFALAEETGLPLFLHSRSCGDIFNGETVPEASRFYGAGGCRARRLRASVLWSPLPARAA